MVKYLSQEWCDLYKEEINKSKHMKRPPRLGRAIFILSQSRADPLRKKVSCMSIFITANAGLVKLLPTPTNTNLHSPLQLPIIFGSKLPPRSLILQRH